MSDDRSLMFDTCPDVAPSVALAVDPSEYARLLGWPRGRPLDEAIAIRADDARDWYRCNGRPWTATRRLSIDACEAGRVIVQGGAALRSARLSAAIGAAGSRSLVVVGASAGIEVDDECARRWQADLPDEAFFLDRLAAAVTEHVLRMTAAGICRDAGCDSLTAMPPLSPGCADWELEDQAVLFGLLDSHGPIRLLSSGMLAPKHSILAVVGLTHLPQSVDPKDLCRSCDLTPCTFRRAPYSLPAGGSTVRRESADARRSVEP